MNNRFTDNFCIRLLDMEMGESKEWKLFIKHINEVGEGNWEGSAGGAYYGLQNSIAQGEEEPRGEEITLQQRINATQKKFYIDI